MNSKKKTGSYYTPLDLADFIVHDSRIPLLLYFVF